MESTPTNDTAAQREIIAGRQFSLGGLLMAVTAICACMALAPGSDPFAFFILGTPAAIARTVAMYRLRKREGRQLGFKDTLGHLALSIGLMIGLWFASIILLAVVGFAVGIVILILPIINSASDLSALAAARWTVGIGALIYVALIWQTWPLPYEEGKVNL